MRPISNVASNQHKFVPRNGLMDRFLRLLFCQSWKKKRQKVKSTEAYLLPSATQHAISHGKEAGQTIPAY